MIPTKLLMLCSAKVSFLKKKIILVHTKLVERGFEILFSCSNQYETYQNISDDSEYADHAQKYALEDPSRNGDHCAENFGLD